MAFLPAFGYLILLSVMRNFGSKFLNTKQIVFFFFRDDIFEILRNPYQLVRIESNGTVSLIITGVFDFYCRFDLYLFPFDTQNCDLVLEVWRDRVQKLHFKDISIEENRRSSMRSNKGEWNFVKMSAQMVQQNYTAGTFDRVVYRVTIKRNWLYATMMSVAPCVMLGIVELTTFFLRYDDRTRLKLSFSCIVAYSMYEILMMNQLPRNSDNTPMFQILIILFMDYIALAIILQALTIYFAEKTDNLNHQQLSPTFIITFNFFSCLFCIDGKLEAGNRWVSVAKLLNRITTVLIFLLISISTIVVFVIWFKNY